MAESVEIKIPLDAEVYDELVMKSEALGQAAVSVIIGAVMQAIESQRIRYANREARLAAMRAESTGVTIERIGV